MTICNFSFSRFGFEGRLWVLFATVPGHCILVTFAIKSDLVRKLSGMSIGINENSIALSIPLSCNKHATIISVYTPTMTNQYEVRDKFYDDIDNIISTTPHADKLIILCDFNARAGRDHPIWEGVIGSDSVGYFKQFATAMVSCLLGNVLT